MSQRAYARHRGVSAATVRRNIKAGKIPVLKDGTIDPKAADKAWARSRDPSKARPGKAPRTAESGGNDAEQSFARLRTAKLATDLQIARLELDRLRGTTIDREEARRAVVGTFREVREAWLNFPNRFGAQMAAELEVDPAALMAVLDRAVREQLTELAEEAPPLLTEK